MFIVTKVAFGSLVKREKFMFDLSTVQMLEFAGTIQFIPNTIGPSDNNGNLIQNYNSVARACEVFDDIVKSLEEGKLVYHLPEE